jgi:hypothetical protein
MGDVFNVSENKFVANITSADVCRYLIEGLRRDGYKVPREWEYPPSYFRNDLSSGKDNFAIRLEIVESQDIKDHHSVGGSK